MHEKNKKNGIIGSTFLTFLCIFWIMPVFIVLWNSFKNKNSINLQPFQLPSNETFVGWENYGAAIGKYGLLQSVGWTVFITVFSVAAILLFCSMCGWFITRVKTWWTKMIYVLCLFSMVVPFQMVMYTLSLVANMLHLTNPFGIIIVYLGFGAGLAIFMFTGFVRSIPIEIEEAAMIDGCNPLQTFFLIVLPILKPTLISVGILETMWLWNDYLLPYLVLDRKKYMTIPILIQYFQGSYGKVEMGPMMACILMTVLPIIIVYLVCQKYIIKGVMAGAVKG